MPLLKDAATPYKIYSVAFPDHVADHIRSNPRGPVAGYKDSTSPNQKVRTVCDRVKRWMPVIAYCVCSGKYAFLPIVTIWLSSRATMLLVTSRASTLQVKYVRSEAGGRRAHETRY